MIELEREKSYTTGFLNISRGYYRFVPNNCCCNHKDGLIPIPLFTICSSWTFSQHALLFDSTLLQLVRVKSNSTLLNKQTKKIQYLPAVDWAPFGVRFLSRFPPHFVSEVFVFLFVFFSCQCCIWLDLRSKSLFLQNCFDIVC